MLIGERQAARRLGVKVSVIRELVDDLQVGEFVDGTLVLNDEDVEKLRQELDDEFEKEEAPPPASKLDPELRSLLEESMAALLPLCKWRKSCFEANRDPLCEVCSLRKRIAAKLREEGR